MCNVADHVYVPLSDQREILLRNIILEEVGAPSPWSTENREPPCVLMTVSTDCSVFGRTNSSGHDIESNLVREHSPGHIMRVLRGVVSDQSISINIDGMDSDMADLGHVPIPREDRSFIRIHNYRRNISCTLLVVSRNPRRVIQSLDMMFRTLPVTVHKWCRDKSRESGVSAKMSEYV